MLTSLPKKKICLNPNRYNFWIEEVERKGQVNEPEVEYAEIRMTGGSRGTHGASAIHVYWPVKYLKRSY